MDNIEINNKLSKILELMEMQTKILDNIYKLFNQYNSQYLEEVEKDNIANINP